MQNSALGVECDTSKFRQDCAPNRGGTYREVCTAHKATNLWAQEKEAKPSRSCVLLVIRGFARLITHQAVRKLLNMNTAPAYVEGLSSPASHHWCN